MFGLLNRGRKILVLISTLSTGGIFRSELRDLLFLSLNYNVKILNFYEIIYAVSNLYL